MSNQKQTAVMPAATGVDDAAGTGQWMLIDWAMKSLSVARFVCEQAGLHDVANEVGLLHQIAQRRRDRA